MTATPPTPFTGAKTQKTSPLCPRERKEMSDVFVVNQGDSRRWLSVRLLKQKTGQWSGKRFATSFGQFGDIPNVCHDLESGDGW
ncbi:hypothetical protein ALP05_00649 [Pseudomonas caricapapayae]|uniref:Uncharacterized protein n=2 Tax=Pseudomonas caricapapayae TaxID=46678 RepID=A0A3M6GG63_9PSED|nr:hypothetical protein ALP05_00649 [Pseudomonas caricapapayae]RMV91454.1 hypothetical protein ALP01_03509 [Pseudomonas caricapapayae]